MTPTNIPPRQQIAFPEVACVRKGTPKVIHPERKRPIQGYDLENCFRIDFYPGTEIKRDAFLKMYAGRPVDADLIPQVVRYDQTYRKSANYVVKEGIEVKRLRCMVFTRSVWESFEWFNEAHNAGRRVAQADDDHYITKRDPVNGEYLVQDGQPFTEFHHGDTIKYRNTNGEVIVLPIRPVIRFKLFLPDLGQMVQFLFRSTSFYDREQLRAQLASLEYFAGLLNGGNAAGIPFYLYRAEKEVTWNKSDGSAARVKKWLVNAEVDPEWVLAATKRLSSFALTGEVSTRAMLPLGDVMGTVDPDNDDDDDVGTAETVVDRAFTVGPAVVTSAVVDATGVVGATGVVSAVTSAEPAPTKTAQVTDEAKTPATPPTRPYPAATLKARLEERAAKTYIAAKASEKQRGLLAMLLTEIFAGDGAEIKRHAVQQYLTGHSSAKDIPDSMVVAMLNDWLKPAADSGGAYHADAMAAKEAQAAYVEAIKSQGQQELPMGENIPF